MTCIQNRDLLFHVLACTVYSLFFFSHFYGIVCRMQCNHTKVVVLYMLCLNDFVTDEACNNFNLYAHWHSLLFNFMYLSFSCYRHENASC